jgi:Ca2+/Na+ antiporter
LLVVADPLHQVQSGQRFPQQRYLFLFFNLITVLVDWLLAISTEVALPLGIDDAILRGLQ